MSRKRSKIEGKYLHIVSRTGFRLVPKLLTWNDLEQRNSRYFASFHLIS